MFGISHWKFKFGFALLTSLIFQACVVPTFAANHPIGHKASEVVPKILHEAIFLKFTFTKKTTLYNPCRTIDLKNSETYKKVQELFANMIGDKVVIPATHSQNKHVIPMIPMLNPNIVGISVYYGFKTPNTKARLPVEISEIFTGGHLVLYFSNFSPKIGYGQSFASAAHLFEATNYRIEVHRILVELYRQYCVSPN